MRHRPLLLVGSLLMLATPAASFAASSIDTCFKELKAENYSAAIHSGKEAVGSNPESAASHYCLGEAYRRSGEQSTALQEMQQAAKLAADPLSKMNVHNRLGMLLSKTDDKDGALREFAQYRSLARQLGRKDDEASAVNNMATLYYTSGLYNMALLYYEDALRLSPDESKNAATYGNMATTYLGKNDLTKAIEYQKKAIDIDRKNSDHHSVSVDLLNLGSIYRRAKQYRQASDSLFEGLEKVRKVQDAYWEGMASRYISLYYNDTGNAGEARKWMKGAADIFTRIGAQSDAKQTQAELEALLTQPQPASITN